MDIKKIKEIRTRMKNNYGITSQMNVNEAYKYNEGLIDGLFWGRKIGSEWVRLTDFNAKLYVDYTGEEY